MKRTHLPGEKGLTLCSAPAEESIIRKDEGKTTCKKCVAKNLRLKRDAKHATPVNAKMIDYTEMQLKFAAHPEVMLRPVKAALEAGYSESKSKADAHNMRKRLWPLIAEFQKMRIEGKYAPSRDRIQRELSALGFSNVIDYLHVNPVTGEARPKTISELTREEAAAIKECEVRMLTKFVAEVDPKTGEASMVERPVLIEDPATGETKPMYVLKSIKLFDKRASLIDLGKTIGMFTDKMNVMLPGGGSDTERSAEVPLSSLSTEALEQISKIMRAAAMKVDSADKDQKALPGECAVVKNG